MINNLIFLPSLLLLTACQIITTNGHVIDSSVIDAIKNNKTTKEQVLELAGTPEIISETSSNKWYYVQRTMSSRLWLQPKVLEQKITEVVFDEHDLVNKVNVICNSNIENIALTSDFTKTKCTETSELQTYIQNIGRFNVKPNKKAKKNNIRELIK